MALQQITIEIPEKVLLAEKTASRVRLVILEGSSHWPFADDPQAVADALLPLLQQQLETH